MPTISPAGPDQIQELFDLLNTRPSTSPVKWVSLFDKTDIRLWISIGAFAGAAGVAAYRSWFDARGHWSFRLGYGLLIACQLCAQATVLRQIYGQFKGFLRPVDTLFAPSLPNIIRDCEALTKLHDYDPGTLDVLARRLKLEADQFRKRINYMAPGIEKIGFIPSLLAGILAFLKVVDSKNLPPWLHLPPGSAVGIVSAIGAVYLSGLILTIASQRIDQLAQLVSMASGKEEEKNDNTPAEARRDSDEESESEDEPDQEQNSDEEGTSSENNDC